MNSQDLLEKYKYYKIQNNIIRKQKILNKNNSPKIKMNISLKTNKCQYFPIESDKSKIGGHTIYLVTQESNYNNENEKNDIFQPEIKNHPLSLIHI